MPSTVQSLQQRQTILRIFVFSLVTVIIWVGFSIFQSQQTTAISPELIKMAEPLNPNINIDIISRIEQKRIYTPEELSRFSIIQLDQNPRSITPPSATPLPSLAPSPAASTPAILPLLEASSSGAATNSGTATSSAQ